LHNAEESVEVTVGGRFQLNSVGLIRRLAALDLGIAVVAEEIVAEDVAQGRLRRILPAWEGPPIPVYAMTETRLLPAKTQRFIEFLRERLNDWGGRKLA
jgi:DNA-binding transcriptional LysR family regulator